jgi:hypothetical protein
MKRANSEKRHTVQVWRVHLSWHGPGPLAGHCKLQIGPVRKGQRARGCGKARCYLCHGDKLLQRPTLQRRRLDMSYKEWQREQTEATLSDLK